MTANAAEEIVISFTDDGVDAPAPPHVRFIRCAPADLVAVKDEQVAEGFRLAVASAEPDGKLRLTFRQENAI